MISLVVPGFTKFMAKMKKIHYSPKRFIDLDVNMNFARNIGNYMHALAHRW
jgi:hypothetical protein